MRDVYQSPEKECQLGALRCLSQLIECDPGLPTLQEISQVPLLIRTFPDATDAERTNLRVTLESLVIEFPRAIHNLMGAIRQGMAIEEDLPHNSYGPVRYARHYILSSGKVRLDQHHVDTHQASYISATDTMTDYYSNAPISGERWDTDDYTELTYGAVGEPPILGIRRWLRDCMIHNNVDDKHFERQDKLFQITYKGNKVLVFHPILATVSERGRKTSSSNGEVMINQLSNMSNNRSNLSSKTSNMVDIQAVIDQLKII